MYSRIITYKPTKEQVERAKNLYPFDALPGSITAGEGNLYGALSEVVYMDFLKERGHTVKYAGSYDYDLIVDNHKVDVKAKHIGVTPNGRYKTGIVDWNIKQECDFYFFALVRKDLSEVYLTGYIGKEEFYKKATYHPIGSEDYNGWKFKANTYNVTINQLNGFAQ